MKFLCYIDDVTIMALMDQDKIPNLDLDYYKRWYYQLGEWLISENHLDITRNDLDILENYFHGGGSCTIALFDAIGSQNINDLVSELRQFAKEYKREDVLEILDTANILDTQKISCLSEPIKFQLASKLDRRIVSVKGWETFATRLKFNHEQREAFRNYRLEPGRFSPTNALFEMIRTKNRNLRLSVIIEWARSAGRNDVAKDLIDFEKEVLNLSLIHI